MQVAGLLVADTTAEQDSIFRQRLQLGWSVHMCCRAQMPAGGIEGGHSAH